MKTLLNYEGTPKLAGTRSTLYNPHADPLRKGEEIEISNRAGQIINTAKVIKVTATEAEIEITA